jgi:hypothetical protein
MYHGPLQRLLDGNLILAFDKTASVLVRCDVLESDVARYGAKERNPRANEHRYTRDSEALDQPGLKKALNCDPAIYIGVNAEVILDHLAPSSPK